MYPFVFGNKCIYQCPKLEGFFFIPLLGTGIKIVFEFCQNLTIEELEKIHKKMISFCEKKANSDDEMKIKSKYIRYEEEVKAGK